MNGVDTNNIHKYTFSRPCPSTEAVRLLVKPLRLPRKRIFSSCGHGHSMPTKEYSECVPIFPWQISLFVYHYHLQCLRCFYGARLFIIQYKSCLSSRSDLRQCLTCMTDQCTFVCACCSVPAELPCAIGNLLQDIGTEHHFSTFALYQTINVYCTSIEKHFKFQLKR